jgi:hypothetical protein
MVIERTKDEVIFRLSADINIDFLQSMSDILTYKELTKDFKVKQNDVDDLVKEIKVGRWEKRKALLFTSQHI